MNLEFPSDDEVTQLIKQTKRFLENPSFDIPQVGKYKKSCKVMDKQNGVEYILHVYRGIIEERYSIHIRFNNLNDHIVRLDINSGTPHKNSDGTKVSRNHIHILKCRNDSKECYAYELDKIPPLYIMSNITFDMDDTLSTSFEKFLSFVNILH